ncbi:beta-galactosidase [candidate division KSB1 bacterium]|nr:beta-galactosidase [candidate division KSB1 bacterium]
MNYPSVRLKLLIFIFLPTLFSCQNQKSQLRQTLQLSGQWQFAIDTTYCGIQQKWYLSDLRDMIELPGTTDLNHKGFLNHDTTTMHLNRVYKYEGPAWYRRIIQIPQSFHDKHIQLVMERTKSSCVWVDDHYISASHLLQSPQYYDLTEFLTPGEHAITIRIDNNMKLTPYGNVHIYTDETQTNWNGIIGDFLLEASPKTYISDLQIFPDVDHKKIQIQIAIANGFALKKIDIELQVNRSLNGKQKSLQPFHQTVPCDSLVLLEYTLGDEMMQWDDYQQPMYQLTVTISNDSLHDSKTAPFGMRKFAAHGTQFTINDRTTFLRGKHDACVFPLTGYPPMDVDGWKRVFEIAKSYGINHYRFHSYCPPDAAFKAADRVGIFLQAELPFWGGLESDSVAVMLKAEGLAMLTNYANHPSFVMFCAGNEIWSGHDRIENIIQSLKQKDSRLLYALGANNNIGYVNPHVCSDYHIAARTPSAGDTTLTHTRLTHAFADSRDGGILNTHVPLTTVNFDYAVSHINIPLISHEIGQYQIFPDYREIKKYTGVVRAWNLEVFRDRLQKAGMLDQDLDFHNASGAWSALCYKAEIEAALRSTGMAGFQLLDLQDYPGQGTALVGILDAFMDSKNVVSRETWLQSCNDVVLLLEFPKYCWQMDENFQAKLDVANYANKTIADDITWEIVNQHGKIIQTGIFPNLNITNGGLDYIGEIKATFDTLKQTEKLTINLALKKAGYSNTYPIWVYPAPELPVAHEGITISHKLNDKVIAMLQQGAKVLLFPTAEFVKANSVGGLFPPDFWNYGMFKGISEWVKKPVSPGTLGLLMNPAHLLFNSFPTDFHTNWQWFSIIKASRPLILNNTAHSYRPIVQVIDNLERNDKLGLIFEFAVGDGKLLVCMSRLNEISDRPEANQLYRSIIHYMNSENFNPDYSIDSKLLKDIL